MTSSPYADLPPSAYWRSGVMQSRLFRTGNLYIPKFPMDKTQPIMTAGSCFAQHVGRALRGSGYNVIDAEPLPEGIDQTIAAKYGYGIYSARYGNIYSVRQFHQLLLESQGKFQPSIPVWEANGRYYDALRPNVEPGGFATPALVKQARVKHLAAVRTATNSAEIVVFTFGLTETWLHKDSGTVYPTAPATIAGEFDPEIYAFYNMRAAEVRSDFEKVRTIFKKINNDTKFVVTVSPVPLTATASGQHVLSATYYSKSVLRGVCGELYEDYDDVDYFPSYELIAGHPTKSRFYESNLRTVSSRGVHRVMQQFLRAHSQPDKAQTTHRSGTPKPDDVESEDDVVCEEILLEKFLK